MYIGGFEISLIFVFSLLWNECIIMRWLKIVIESIWNGRIFGIIKRIYFEYYD